MIKDKRQKMISVQNIAELREAEWKEKMITILTIVAIVVGIFALYNYVVKPRTDTTGSPGYLSGGRADTSIVNNPGENPASVTDAPPEFTNPILRGYSCLRCSDAGDKDKVQDPLDAKVNYTCPASASNWKRGGTNVRLMFETRDKAYGNYASYYQVPENTQDPLSFCTQQCINLKNNSDLGECKATTFDKNKNVCRFFYACEKVKKSSDCDTVLVDFDVSQQPDVITNEG